MKREDKIRQMTKRLKNIVDKKSVLLREMSAILDYEELSKALDGGMIPKVQRRIEDLRSSLKDIEMGLEMVFRASLPIIAHEGEWENE